MSEPQIKNIPPCIQTAIIDTFKIQLSTAANVKSIQMNKNDISSHSIDVMSVLGLKSADFVGTIALGFPEKTFLAVLERMLGEKYTEITSEIADACSEILNIVFSSARKNINESGFSFEPSIPSTISGKGLTLAQSSLVGNSLFFDCESDAGSFIAILALKKN